MITVRKLATLASGTRLRKAARLIEGWIRAGEVPDDSYLADFLTMLAGDGAAPAPVRSLAETTRDRLAARGRAGERPANRADPPDPLRALDDLRHLLLADLGEEPADWDLLPPAGVPGPEAEAPALASVGLYLDAIRSPFNLGSIIRTAAAFGVRLVGVSAECPPLDHPRVLRSAMGAVAAVTVVRDGVDEVVRQCGGPLVALESGGEPIHSFGFPSSGVLVLGSEELGVRAELLRRADARLSIPMPGAKGSLNVGVACGIALAAWQASAYRGDGTATSR